MKLKEFLTKNQKNIVKEWFDVTIKTYPTETAHILGKQKDPFANPVGQTTYQALRNVFTEFIQDFDHDKLSQLLDPIIRIRAVQAFAPSMAVVFIFYLKAVIRKELEKKQGNEVDAIDLSDFESKIDDLTLIAFDVYMGCRERLYRIKATEEKKRTFSAFERAGLISELPEEFGRGIL